MEVRTSVDPVSVARKPKAKSVEPGQGVHISDNRK
jgi:hypothetical protein